jgi:hypothetical protein
MTSPAPVSYPLGAPTVVNTSLTVDIALLNPAVITRRIADLTSQRFIVDRVFTGSGVSVAAGAVLYEQMQRDALFMSRNTEQRGPGDEYPILSGTRGPALVAVAEDWGGKFFVTDEARSRNDARFLDQQTTQLANTLVRKVNSRAVETIEAAVSPAGSIEFVTGNDWSAFQVAGSTPTPNRQQPIGDFAKVQALADADELGVTFDLWLVHPTQWEALTIGYGSDLPDTLKAAGIEVFASNRIAPGVAYAVARGQVGFLDYERQLSTETWREQATRRTWIQSYVMPVMGITNPYAIRKVVGLGV